MFDGVRVARVLRDGRLVLDVSAPDFQQNHVKRNVSIEPAVLAAVAHGAQLVAKRAGLAAWARLVPRRIDEAAVSADGIADVERIVLDLVPGTEGLGGRVLLLDGSGRLVGELTDVWWGDEDAEPDALRPTRRAVPAAHALTSAAGRISMSARVPDTAEAVGTGISGGTGFASRNRSAPEVETRTGPETKTPTDPKAETLTDPESGPGAGSDGAAAVAFVAGELRVIAAGILGFEADEIEPTTGFYAFGFDSISLVTLAKQVGERFGVRVSPALFFDLDTLDALARHLVAEFGDRIPSAHPSSPAPDAARATARPATPPTAPASEPTSEAAAGPVAPQPVAPEPAVPKADVPCNPDALAPRGASLVGDPAPAAATPDGSGAPMPVAIVGAAGRFPGARDLDAYWANLVGGVDSVTEFPADRYDETYARVVEEADFPPYAGVLDDVDAFDAGFFGIYPREAELLDPQHRLALETVWSALEDSAHRPAELPADTGVFLGVSGTDYATLLTGYGVAPDAFTATGNAHSMLANRVSFTLDLRGPSEPVDTACSSSLVALHRALEAIRSGACSMAIAGGVNLLLSTDTFVSAHRAGMLSPDGRCRTFSDDANGYVRGEGVGAVVLKPLAAAERDGDDVLGVLLGSAENHGGRAHSLTAPNADAQAEVVAAAVGDTDPDTIGYIETHGTGTALGDPVEVRALRSAFRRLGAAGRGACGLGSVKTNIGHLEAAAGIAGLLKVLLAMEHGVLPGTLHCREVNPHIELDDGPFRLVRENEAWPRPTGRDGTPAPGARASAASASAAPTAMSWWRSTPARTPARPTPSRPTPTTAAKPGRSSSRSPPAPRSGCARSRATCWTGCATHAARPSRSPPSPGPCRRAGRPCRNASAGWSTRAANSSRHCRSSSPRARPATMGSGGPRPVPEPVRTVAGRPASRSRAPGCAKSSSGGRADPNPTGAGCTGRVRRAARTCPPTPSRGTGSGSPATRRAAARAAPMARFRRPRPSEPSCGCPAGPRVPPRHPPAARPKRCAASSSCPRPPTARVPRWNRPPAYGA